MNITICNAAQTQLQTQQRQKLVAYDTIGNTQQGYSLAITKDGNTMAVGSPGDNNGTGAVWIWTQGQNNIWTVNQKICGFTSGSNFGSSIAFSGIDDNGNTLAIGGCEDNNGVGAVWVYTRTSAAYAPYSLQGSKIVPSDLAGSNNKVGYSVALSSDGNKLAIGGPGNNANKGSTWIWIRTDTTWSQQKLKLYGSTSSTTPSKQGTSVALSEDGNTLVIGGVGDDNGNGAVWIYVWSGTSWTLLQSKLTDNTNTAASNQGASVIISTDGNMIVYGSPLDNNGVGSVSVWGRTSSSASASGSNSSSSAASVSSSSAAKFTKIQKMIGTGTSNTQSNQGTSVAISDDGLTLIVGGSSDDNNIGATWIYKKTKAENLFYQYGTKRVGSEYIGACRQGYAVALSPDGTSMYVGGYTDNTSAYDIGIGAVWVFDTNVVAVVSTNAVVSANANANVVVSANTTQQYMCLGNATPTAPLSVSYNNYNSGSATNTSCLDIYNNNKTGGAFQRYFSNNQSDKWWHVGSESGYNHSFHIMNQNGTGVYMNSGDQSWSSYSDQRLNTSISNIDISNAYQNILKLNPVTYKDVNGGKQRQGLVAQDVLPVIPQVVTMNHGLYGIGYTELIPYLIAGMKQQATIISQQQEKIAAFEERLAALETKLN